MTTADDLQAATFLFPDWMVMFVNGNVEVLGTGGGTLVLKIEQGDWRPCVTHCRQLIRMAKGLPPANEFDRKRREPRKPELRVLGEKECEA